ncbi:leucine-rich repeat and transmembrane domain-containing protein 1 [Periophthalmus magnuspinnatus]|uniref:leucine-rich repeat and transmembrane domain-containing protein 1 n=1 Tax=Periophthalmus magnuspinnatus TaxID=409849 RepID=UPI0024365F3A|nr:leucine-rich repeat and transmembrane domain-containing protein 1 [Periophthalmus magnuspinnatus]
MVLLCKSAVLWLLLVWTKWVGACICPSATVLSLPPSIAPPGGCCLNLSGSALGLLNWAWFSNVSGLEVLDLSYCNITHIHKAAADRGPSSLTKLFLNHNTLLSVPKDLLSSMFNLTELDLQGNQLYDLSPDLLQDSNQIQKLNLKQNKLHFLPAAILKKPSLTTLDIEDNPWDCSCQFIEEIELSYNGNRSTGPGALANLTCASPPSLDGREVLGVSVGEACHPTRLTALFIALPLFILSALVLCWCCGQPKSKEAPTFNGKKKGHNNHSNSHKELSKPPTSDLTQDPKSESIVQNQLLLRPSSALLSSTRDIYQEVEGRLGSVDSLPMEGSLCSSLGDGRPGSQVVVEVDAVSVTEVLRDSTDREKAYLTQSTEYYSLVPGLQLDDSDHGEFDNVDLT